MKESVRFFFKGEDFFVGYGWWVGLVGWMLTKNNKWRKGKLFFGNKGRVYKRYEQ